MNLNIDGASCAHCKAYLFSEDDIVYCPICGAPHHRECYNSLGHCAFEELHGTDKQYSREKALEAREKIEKEKAEAQNKESGSKNITKCKMCGEIYPYDKANCPKCGAPNFNLMNGMRGIGPLDFLGGIPAEQEIAEGITAEEARKFVITNTHRYIPKFAKLNNDKKISWNWLAFFFPSCWLLSRKMYKGGIISTVLLIIVNLLSYPFRLSLLNLDLSNIVNPFELTQNIITDLPQNGGLILIATAVSLIIELSVRFITAAYGDYWYKSYTVDTIRKIREEKSDQIDEEYRKKGGVNIMMFILGYFILQYLPLMLLSLF